MPVDYDLVILGGAAEGRIAAMTAADCGARVALVEPPGLFDQNQQARYLLQGLQQLGENVQRQAVGRWFCAAADEAADEENFALDWAALVEWSAIATETQSTLSPAAMSANGVDVVLETPLHLSQKLVVTTAERLLRSRAILAAFGTLPMDLAPLSDARSLSKKVTITGGSPLAILWAEALGALGTQVILVAERFLPTVDEAIRQRVRSQLLAAGVTIVHRGEVDCSADCLAIAPRPPALELPSFVYSLAAKQPLLVNRRLQSAHPRIFACGELLGGSADFSIAEYEAKVAVKNALFLPRTSVDYSAIPQGHRRFSQIGLTQAQAEQRYGNAVRVWASSHANADDLSRPTPLPEYCKLVCVSGKLVGVHLLGEGADMLIQLLIPAIGRSIGELGRTVVGLPASYRDAQTLAGLVDLAAGEAGLKRWQLGHWRRDWAENWFNWRRSR